jgi:hypothetical protein
VVRVSPAEIIASVLAAFYLGLALFLARVAHRRRTFTRDEQAGELFARERLGYTTRRRTP